MPLEHACRVEDARRSDAEHRAYLDRKRQQAQMQSDHERDPVTEEALDAVERDIWLFDSDADVSPRLRPSPTPRLDALCSPWGRL